MLTYLVSVFTIATAAYFTISFPINHLPSDKRENFSLWLLGAYEDSWASQFCKLFDFVFGIEGINPRSVIRSLVRSSVASLLSVFLLFLLFSDALGIVGNRTKENIDIYYALAIAAAVNIIPDYFSLLETRWVLQKMKGRSSFRSQFGLVLLDLALTTLIIYVAIQLYVLAKGQGLISFPELLGAFSVYSIFFYSTFLTSAWSLIYALSIACMRIFVGLNLSDHMDVEEDPGGSLGIFSAICLFLLVLAVKPFFTPDHLDRTVFDRGLCKLFSGKACEHAARLSSDPRARTNYFVNACFSQSERACSNETLNENYRALCGHNNGWGCQWLGISHRDGRELQKDPYKAHELFLKACELNVGWSCMHAGRSLLQGKLFLSKPSEARTLLEKACALDSGQGCSELALAFREGKFGEPDHHTAHEYFVRSCSLNYGFGCKFAGWNLFYNDQLSKRPLEALEFLKKACALNDEEGCRFLGTSYKDGITGKAELLLAERFYQKACDLGDKWACDNNPFGVKARPSSD